MQEIALGGFSFFILLLAVFAVIFIRDAVKVVPQQEAWVVERFGKFHSVLEPGLNFIVPLIDKVAYKQTLKEIPMDTSSQICITKDNTQLQVDGVLYFQVTNPELRNIRLCHGHYSACSDIAQKRDRHHVAR